MKDAKFDRQRFGRLKRYLLGLGIAAVAVGLRFAAFPLEAGMTFITFYPALIVIFYLCGFGPGLMSGLLFFVVAEYVFLPPYWSFRVNGDSMLGLLIFTITAGLIGWTIDALQRYVQHLDDLFRNSPTGMALIEPNGGAVLKANAVFVRMLGDTAEKNLVGKPIAEFILPDVAGGRGDEIYKPFSGKADDLDFESRYLRKDGSVLDAQIIVSPLKTEIGKPALILVNMLDIGERKKAELLRMESFDKLQTVIESMPLPLALLDEFGNIGFLNTQFQDTIGYTLADIPTLDAWWPLAYPDAANRRLAMAKWSAMVAATEARGGDIPEMTVSIQCKNRPPRSFVVCAKRLCGAAFSGTLIIFYDITERRELEEQLRRVLFEVEDLYDHAPCGYHSLDANGVFLNINDTELEWLGYERGEVVNKMNFADVVDRDSAAAFKANYPRFIANGSIGDLEYVLLHKDGSSRTVGISATAVIDVSGKFLKSRSVLYDITELKKAQAMIALENEKNKVLLSSASDGIHILDMQGHVVEFSDSFAAMLGYSHAEATGLNVKDWDVFFDDLELLGGIRRLTEGWTKFETKHKRKNGEIFDAEITAKGIVLNGQIHLYAAARDISERKRMEAELKRQARTDYLTGVYNRGYFTELAELELSRMVRHGGAPTVLMMDIDHFKQINDGYGHKAGDLVLKRFADICKAGLRDIDIFGRLGGEEFAILLVETDRDGAYEVAERLRKTVAATEVALDDGAPVRFTVSVGISAAADADTGVDGLLKSADRALYRAKQSGRNRVC